MARRSRARRRRVTTAKRTSSPYGPSNWRSRLAALLGATRPAATPAPRRTYTPRTTTRRTRAIGVPGGTSQAQRRRIQAQYVSPQARQLMGSYRPPTIKPKTAVSPLIAAGLRTAAGGYKPTVSPAAAAGSLVRSVLDPYYGGRPPWHAGRGYTPRTRYPPTGGYTYYPEEEEEAPPPYTPPPAPAPSPAPAPPEEPPAEEPDEPSWWGEELFGEDGWVYLPTAPGETPTQWSGEGEKPVGPGWYNLRYVQFFNQLPPQWREWLSDVVKSQQGKWTDPAISPIQWMTSAQFSERAPLYMWEPLVNPELEGVPPQHTIQPPGSTVPGAPPGEEGEPEDEQGGPGWPPGYEPPA